MPIYEFACQDCGHEFEKIQSFSDSTTPDCPNCLGVHIVRRISPPAIHFKGSGWYITDSKSSSKKSASGEPSGGKESARGDAGDKGDEGRQGREGRRPGRRDPAAASQKASPKASRKAKQKASPKARLSESLAGTGLPPAEHWPGAGPLSIRNPVE